MKLIRTFFFFFQAEDGIRDRDVTGVQTCALPILAGSLRSQVEEFITKDAVAAKCVVHAEGAAPDAEEKRYAQDAVVALVHTDPPAHSAAFERFTPEGPLALLPFAGRYAMVWSRRPERARALANAPDAEFLAELGAAAGHRPGRPVKVEARAVH